MNYEKCQKCETFHNLSSKHKATESRRRLAFRGVKRASSTFRLCQHGQDKPCNTYVGTAGHRVLQNSPRLSPEKTGMSCRLQNRTRGEEDIKYDEGPTETPASISSTVNGFSFEFEFAFDFLPIVIFSKAVPLQRAYIGGASSAADHFYTTSAEEMALAVSRHGYKQEADVGKVHTSQESGTVPLYRSFNEPASDHYYTNSTQERDSALSMYGYRDEGIAAYVYVDDRCGGIPLYMLFSASASDHFYTTSEAEANASGYKRERVVGYVLPS